MTLVRLEEAQTEFGISFHHFFSSALAYSATGAVFSSDLSLDSSFLGSSFLGEEALASFESLVPSSFFSDSSGFLASEAGGASGFFSSTAGDSGFLTSSFLASEAAGDSDFLSSGAGDSDF